LPASTNNKQTIAAEHYDKVWQEEPTKQGEIGESWESWRFFQLAPSARLYALGLLGSLKAKKVLDLACGVGFSSLELAQAGAEVIALDLSEQGLKITRQRAKAKKANITPLRSSVEQLPFADNSFDLIFAQNFLMHVSVETVGKECYRVLKPGGRVVFTEPLAHHPLVKLYRKFFSEYKDTAPRWTTLADMQKLAATFPTGASKLKQFYFLSAVASLSAIQKRPLLLQALFGVSSRVDNLLQNTLPFLRRYYWVAVMELEKPLNKGQGTADRKIYS
jgi:ubiquinone/menaquinone biosynthesis C-methylase UbiE